MKAKVELVVIMRDERKQRNVKGAVLADKSLPPFAANHDGYYLRWWGVDHPASKRIRELVKIKILCPDRGRCFEKRIRVSKHAIPWHKCAFEEHHSLYQCPASGNGLEPIPDRGDIEARCAGAAFCGDASCDHAKAHRWNPMTGCHSVRCRKLEMALTGWNEETKGPPPDMRPAQEK
jgi:hypothetical protein